MSEEQMDLLLNTDLESLRSRILSRFTVGQIQNEFFLIDTMQELELNDTLIKKQHELLLEADLMTSPL